MVISANLDSEARGEIQGGAKSDLRSRGEFTPCPPCSKDSRLKKKVAPKSSKIELGVGN